MTLSSNFAAPANPRDQAPAIPLSDFQTIFQLDSTLYRHTIGEAAMLHPGVGLSVAVMIPFHEDADEITDEISSIKRISSLQTPHGHQIIYGEYCRRHSNTLDYLNERRVFLTMTENRLDPDLSPEDAAKFEDPFTHIPHVTLHGAIEKHQGQKLLRPLGMCVGISLNDDNDMRVGSLQTSEEFLRGLCYADAAMCQIMARRTLKPEMNLRWITHAPILNVLQKVEWMASRDQKEFSALITSYKNQPETSP